MLVDLGPAPTKKKGTGLVDLGPAPTPLTEALKAVEEPVAISQAKPSVEPTQEDLDIYKRMGVKKYRSPAGKPYDLTLPPPQIPLGTPRDIRPGELVSLEPIRAAKQIIPQFVGGVEEMIGTMGSLVQWASDISPLANTVRGVKAKVLLRRLQNPALPKTEKKRLAGKFLKEKDWLSKKAERWADWWEEQASKGWEAPDPEVMKAKWGEKPLVKGAAVISRAVPNYLAAIAASILTKSPQTGLLFISGISGAGAYRRQIKAGTGKQMANAVASGTAAWEYVTEKVPFEAVFKPSKHLLLKMLKVGTLESAQEFVQGIGENFLEYFGYTAKDLDSVPAAVKEGLQHTMDGWVENVVAGAGLGVLGAGVVGKAGFARPSAVKPLVKPPEIAAAKPAPKVTPLAETEQFRRKEAIRLAEQHPAEIAEMDAELAEIQRRAVAEAKLPAEGIKVPPKPTVAVAKLKVTQEMKKLPKEERIEFLASFRDQIVEALPEKGPGFALLAGGRINSMLIKVGKELGLPNEDVLKFLISVTPGGQAAVEAKPEAKLAPAVEEPAKTFRQEFDEYWKWSEGKGYAKPQDLDDAVLEYLADTSEKYQDIEGRFVELDQEGKGKTPEAKKLESQLFAMRKETLAKLEKEKQAKPTAVEGKLVDLGPAPKAQAKEEKYRSESEELTAKAEAEAKETLPIEVKASDISFQRAVRAASGIHMIPENSAYITQRDYLNTMMNVYNELKPLAKSDEQRAILKEELERFRDNYIKWQNDIMGSESGIVSSFIVGPAKFPVKRMQKKQSALENKINKYSAWKEKAIKGMKKKIKFQAIEDAGGPIAVMEKKLADAIKLQEMMRKANAVIRKKGVNEESKIKALVQLGFSEGRAKHLLTEKDYAGRLGFAGWQLSNNNANIKRMKQRLAEMQEAGEKAGEETIAKYEGVEIVNNFDEERVQILFDDKPSEAVRKDLRGNGWRWSPKNKVWQRKNTIQAVRDSKSLVEKHFAAKPPMGGREAGFVDLAPAPAAERPTEQEIDETGGVSKRRRSQLIKQTEQEVGQSSIYANELAAIERQGREIGQGFYYVQPELRGEVENIVGKAKGFPTKLQGMFTFESGTLATSWAKAAQERGIENIDISEFVQRVKESVERQGKVGRLNAVALANAEKSGDPWLQYKITKLQMLQQGYSAQEIDDMTAEFAEGYEIPLEEFDKEWVGPEPLKLKEIKKITDETEQDKAIEVLARENVLRRERDQAKNAVREVLRANDIKTEVRKVEEIEAEEEIPFEKRGRPTGAVISQAGREVVLLAYGADSATGYHEAYHVLRRRLTAKDTTILDRHFKGNEEAEAAAFAEFAKTGKTTKSYLKGIWQKLVNLLRKVKSGLQGRGFRTVEDIFRQIQVGKIAKGEARRGPARYERGVFGQPIQRQLRLPLKQRQKAIKRAAVAEKARPGKKTAGKPFEYWHPRGRAKIKPKLIKAVDNIIEKHTKKNVVQITPEEIAAELRRKTTARLFYEPAEKKALRLSDLFYDADNPLPEVQEAYDQLIKGGPLFDIRYETRTDKMIRDVIRAAQVKAEKARLKAMAKPKKKKAPAIRRIKLNIRDTTPILREDLKPLEMPAAKEPPRGGRKPPYFSDAWYRENIKKQRGKWLGRLKPTGKRAFLTGEKILSSSSTRLYNIHPELFRQTRRYVYDVLNRTAAMVDAVEPWLKGTKRMSGMDHKQLDLAQKNSDTRKITELVIKYGIQKQYDQAREVLDEIFDTAKEVGIDIDYHREYWHRHIKNPQGFLEYFQGREDWSIIEEAIRRRAEQAGRKIEELTDDERAQVVNTLLRGYRTQALALARPGAAKERVVDVVWSDINQFYDSSDTALMKYIKLMNAKIAEREFFGRETKEIQNLRKVQSARLTRLIKLKKRQGLRPGITEPKYKEHISKTYEAWKAGNERLNRLTNRSPKDTIGGYVYDLVRQGQIGPTQEKQIQDILTGIFAPRGMRRSMGLFSTAIYIDTLNSPIQALTQLDEFAYAFYRSPLRSIPVAIRTAFRISKIKPGDIGIKSIGVEFQGPSMKRALTLLLKSTGFELVDRLNKENYINTVLSKYQAQARSTKERPALVKRLGKVFGKDYKKVLEDLRKPIRSLDDLGDDVKYLLFNELLDIQPIAITEMPEAYNKSGNLRILYTLKTFYIKRLDFIRNESFKDMKSPKTFVRGFSKLVWLAFSFALFGATSDFLKDFIKGRAFDLKDSLVDNMLRMFMSSKFQVTQTQREGLGRAVLEQWIPPTKAVDEISKDVVTIVKGKDRGFEIWRSVPLVGELYYWWFGRGREKIERKKGKKGKRKKRMEREKRMLRK